MRFNLVSFCLLYVITWMSSIDASIGPAVSNCCVGWSDTKVPIEKIVNYTIQSDDVCPIKAIVIKTKAGKTFCSNPNKDWVKKAIEKVDKETQAAIKGQNEEGSTSDITPTVVSTTSKKTPRKRRGCRCKNRRRRMKCV